MEQTQSSEKIRKVFLDGLPRWEDGRYKGKIKWKDTIGYKVRFIYDNIEGSIEIVDYKGRNLYIKYLNDIIHKIDDYSFSNCKLNKLFNPYTKEFKIEIGAHYKDDKRDITIIDREYRIEYDKKGKKHNYKYYKYHCNICTWDEGWSTEYDILGGNGCSCCTGKPVLGINTIYDTDKWMIPIVGEEFAKTHTHSCSDSIFPTCPDCGRKRDKKIHIYQIYYNHSISCSCSDKIPYPEKLMYSVLIQLKIGFQTQLSKTTFKWCEKYKYDFSFVLNNQRYIIETHGEQHYNDCGWSKKDNVQENDKLKKELALANGIKEENYIVIDCRKSELDWIKRNILKNDRLKKLFDLSIINWLKCGEFAISNLVKKVCEIKRDNPNLIATEIASIMDLNVSTIRNYLKKGSEIWKWANYNFQKTIVGKSNGKPVEIFKNKISLGIFESTAEIERQSEKLFGVKLSRNSIARVCRRERTHHKGYTFKYVE